MDLKLTNKVAIVTGASRGLGRAIALELAREKVKLYLVARDEAALKETARLVTEAGSEAKLHACDLTNIDAASAAVAAAVAAFGGVDMLVNCAGATKRGEFFSLSDHDFHDGFELKFHGTVRMSRAAWPHLAARRGTITNIVGIGAITPGAEFTIGGPVNAALLNFTKALSEIGEKAGVRVNAINPGYVRTERLSRRIRTLAEERSISFAEAEATLRVQLKITRFGESDEIGRLVAFLASEQASYIQGAIINIDGGATKSL